MQQQPNPLQPIPIPNPLFHQHPLLPDPNLLQLCPPLPYPHPPMHYRQQHIPPNLPLIRQFTDGHSSFGLTSQGIKLTVWQSIPSNSDQIQPYDPTSKFKLKSLNNSIHDKMKTILRLIKDGNKPEMLRQMIQGIQDNVGMFYRVSKSMKECQVKRGLYEKCEKERRKYEALKEKYGKIVGESLDRLVRYAKSPTMFQLIDQ